MTRRDGGRTGRSMLSTRRLRILRRLATEVCPPEAEALGLGRIAEHVAATMSSMSPLAAGDLLGAA